MDASDFRETPAMGYGGASSPPSPGLNVTDELARRLGARRAGREWRAPCLLHDDKRPSMDFREGDNGLPIFECRSLGCDSGALAARARELHPDLFPTKGNGRDQGTEYRI